jgi:dodecin
MAHHESIARVTEISARSPDSFEDALKRGVSRATKTLRNVQGAWVKEQEAVIEDDEIVAYEVKLKITFELEE